MEEQAVKRNYQKSVKSMQIEVLEDVASLKAIYDNTATPDTRVFFYEGTRHWAKTYGQVQKIYADRNISVSAKSDKEDRGLFSIGDSTNWYYSHSLFSTPEKLKEKILEMLRFSLTGEV